MSGGSAAIEVDGIAAEMGIDAAEIAARKACLALGEADAARLRALRGRPAAAAAAAQIEQCLSARRVAA